MATPKPKMPVRRTKKAAISPPPEGPVGGSSAAMDPACGHSNCGRMCQVRYVGPTSHMRDHHIMHAAQGVSQVWTAAIVAGLAVVLTGAIAWSSVQAATTPPPSLTTVYAAVQNLNKRMDKVDAALAKINSQCNVTAQCNNGTNDQKPTADQCEARCKAAQSTATSDFSVDACVQSCENPGSGTPPTNPPNTCLVTCSQQTLSCIKSAGDATDARQKCMDADTACRKTCQTAPSTNGVTGQ